MKTRFIIFASLFVFLLGVGCRSVDSSRWDGARLTSLRAMEEYQIAVNDLLEVSFLEEPQYTQEVRVNWNGAIHLSFLGGADQLVEVVAAGKTATSLTGEVNLMAKRNGVLNEPRSQIRVLKYAEQTFSVLGHVFIPGRHPFPSGQKPMLGIGEAIAIAGGYTQLANISSVYIKRNGEVFRVNLKKLLTDPGEEIFWVFPGDIVTVTERII